MTRLCSVEGCGKPIWARGLCGTHYRRWERHGDAEFGGPVRKQHIGPCLVDGCTNPVKARGLCNAHWHRWRVHGDPLSGATSKGELLRYLREVVLPYQGDECLIWPFGRTTNGYARMQIGKETVTVSRRVCEEVNGPPPTPNHDAAHSCGQGQDGCVTPGHLRWATRSDNNMDKVEHGTHLRGERHVSHKLSTEDARRIRSLRGRMMQKDIAAMFGVSRETVGQIQRRQRWAWLDDGQ